MVFVHLRRTLINVALNYYYCQHTKSPIGLRFSYLYLTLALYVKVNVMQNLNVIISQTVTDKKNIAIANTWDVVGFLSIGVIAFDLIKWSK